MNVDYLIVFKQLSLQFRIFKIKQCPLILTANHITFENLKNSHNRNHPSGAVENFI